MPDKWKKCTLMLNAYIYEEKRHKYCSKYCVIKLKSHTINYGRQKLRHKTNVSEYQFGFMSERLAMEAYKFLEIDTGVQREEKESSYGIY